MSAQAEESELVIGAYPYRNLEIASSITGSTSVGKLRDLDRLLSTMIHQIRNHCMSVKGYASLLIYEEGISDKGRKWLSNIDRGLCSLERFLTEFESYRFSKNPKHDRLDIALAVKGAWKSLTESSDKNVALEFEVPDDLVIFGDNGDFSKMIFHLLKNAFEAVGDKGLVRVVFSKEICSNGSGCGWNLEVQDNGFGMTEKELSRACEILFTTKKGHIGCGLNLVAAVASRMGAELEISSKRGMGSIVRIRKLELA